MQIIFIYVLQQQGLRLFVRRYLCIAFVHLRSIFIAEQVVTCTFLSVACIIIEPRLHLLRLEIPKKICRLKSESFDLYSNKKKFVLLTFECTSTAVRNETHQALQLLFLCRVSQRKQQVGLAWTPSQNIRVDYRIIYRILYVEPTKFQIKYRHQRILYL